MEENCPCCPNHRSKDNLNCDRGRDYFNGSSIREESSNESSTVQKLKKCGHMLHHNRYIDESELFKNLSEEEVEMLDSLLTKVLD